MKTNTLKPTIGITVCYDDGRLVRQGIKYNIIRREYGEQVKAAGAKPIYIDANISPADAAQLCDGIVISGGEDIDPTLYGGRRVKKGEHVEPRARTDWEHDLIDACDKRGVPILGICYGSQLLNLHYGGTLCQDIASEVDGALNHGTPTNQVIHEVLFEQPFLNFLPGERRKVAARHHQAVKAVAPGFKVVARTPDGVIEAISGRGHYGVQWHAEADATAPQIYSNFIKACRKRYLPKAWAKSWEQVRTGSRMLTRPKPKSVKKK